MSSAETVTPKADVEPQSSETSKSDQTAAPLDSTESTVPINVVNPAEPAAGDQTAPVQSAASAEVSLTENQNADVVSVKVVGENPTECPVKANNETEDTKNIAVQESSTDKAVEESSNVSKVEGSECIGAGDRSSQDSKETIKVITEQTSVTSTEPNNKTNSTSQIEKSFVGNSADANANEQTISKLKSAVQKMTEERDSYQKKLEITEKKLAALQTSYDDLIKGAGDETMLRRMMEQLKGKLIQTSLQLEDRIRVVANQEKQISALNNQVASLKEVEALTRSLLQIRNMEVKHLQAEVDDMEVRISEERERYNTMINKMDAAVQLNASLKKEYETQLSLFRDLREKYEEKVTLLSEEKRALETAAQNAPK